jgi:plasmid stabilization system protein ParE
MTASIIWLPKAERDLADITTYYQHISPSLVMAIRAELEAVQSQLRDFPHSFQAVNATLRRAFLTRFPYTLYFRTDDTIVTITAILPQRSKPINIARSGYSSA